MTPKERFLTALNLGIPDRIPTFELEFQLADELLGKPFLTENDLIGKTPEERKALIWENAQYMIDVYTKLENDAICIHYLSEESMVETVKAIRALSGDTFALFGHGDGTFGIMDGDDFANFAVRLYEDPDGVLRQAEAMADNAIAYDLRMLEAGMDGFILCSDYCFNQGPFMSPEMFSKFVFPFLKKIIAAIREHGGYAIKHTDGNIMPILDQLIAANPHALHSLDPMAGVDIAEVKRLTAGKVALCGNVHCAAMQNGTEEEVIRSAEYCITNCKPGGGYIFASSNTPFKGMPLERYLLILDVWKRMRDY